MSEERNLTTPSAVDAIVATPDPVLRNLRITESYHQLALAYEPYLGGADRHWCAFATWASNEAGRFIRGDVVPAPLRRFLGTEPGSPRRRWTPDGWLRAERFLAYTRTTLDDVRAHVATGNRIVYAKLAPLFARLLEQLRHDGALDAEGRDAFLATIRDDPDTRHALRRAFGFYLDALSERDERLRSQRIFLANVLVGWHEQRRLQEPIQAALDAPVRRALADPERRWSALPMPAPLRRLGATLFGWALAPTIRRFEAEFRQAATRSAMTLALPDEVLDLSDDVPPLPDGAAYPPPLVTLDLPGAAEVLAPIDPTPDSPDGSAASDWSRLDQRMHYIADLFRSRQRRSELLRPPLTSEQRRRALSA